MSGRRSSAYSGAGIDAGAANCLAHDAVYDHLALGLALGTALGALIEAMALHPASRG